MGKIKLTLVKGKSGATQRQIRTLEALGLKKRASVAEIDDNVVTKGMVMKVQHLLIIEKL